MLAQYIDHADFDKFFTLHTDGKRKMIVKRNWDKERLV